MSSQLWMREVTLVDWEVSTVCQCTRNPLQRQNFSKLEKEKSVKTGHSLTRRIESFHLIASWFWSSSTNTMRKHTKNSRFHLIPGVSDYDQQVSLTLLFHFDSSLKRLHWVKFKKHTKWNWGNTWTTVVSNHTDHWSTDMSHIFDWKVIWLIFHLKTIFAFVPWIKTSCQLTRLLFIRFSNGVKSYSTILGVSVKEFLWKKTTKP